MTDTSNEGADSSVDRDSYALRRGQTSAEIALPVLDYQPARPQLYQPSIGLIGCGGITAEHLTAYQNAGYAVAALADIDVERARRRRDEYYPEAEIYDDPQDLLRRDDLDVVDIATHPAPRVKLIADALTAGKHVLSQKPFVMDLDEGERLCDLADKQGVRLAVNQNGRWAPYVAWMRKAIERGLIGAVTSVDSLMAWDHRWVAGTPFERIPQLLLYDFAIHWFDMLHCYTRAMQPQTVSAQLRKPVNAPNLPPLLGQVIVELDGAQAALAFRGCTSAGELNSTLIVGTEGTLHSSGPDLEQQEVKFSTTAGAAAPPLEGSWFPGGFDGAMSELVVAIENDRVPYNCGRDTLDALAMCFAAMQSADAGAPVKIGSVRRVRQDWMQYS